MSRMGGIRKELARRWMALLILSGIMIVLPTVLDAQKKSKADQKAETEAKIKGNRLFKYRVAQSPCDREN